MQPIKIIFFGTPDFVNPVLETLKKNFQVVGVVTSNNNLTIQELKKLKPDLFVVASYGKILSGEFLSIPKHGSLNIHPSLLPKYRGASPIQAAILKGDEVSGITIIKMDEAMDHGPIIYQEQFKLSEQDTFDSLSKKMFARSAEILPKIIEEFVAGKIHPRNQNHAIATFCEQVKKQDGYFEIENLSAGRQVASSPEKLDRMIRAYYPWPGVWTRWRVKSQKSRVKECVVKFLPGGLVQMEGKKAVPLKDFLNGYPDFPIKKLTDD